MNTNDLEALDNVTKDFEIFRSRVANAVLDYMEMQSDSELRAHETHHFRVSSNPRAMHCGYKGGDSCNHDDAVR